MTTEKGLTDEQLQQLAARFVLAMMSSASTSKIKPIDWWVRAQSALEAAAAMSDSLPQMASKMARKLQIEAPESWTSREVKSVSSDLGEEFERFRSLCEREAFFIIAMARVERDRQLAAREREHADFGGL